MPNYDYFCDKCGHASEQFQKITDAPLTQCPQCHEHTLRRGIGGGGALLRFKGSGFYITDYCKKEEGSPSASDSSGNCGCKGSHSCS